MRRILAVVRKELLVLLKDPRGRGILIAPVFVQLLVFGYAANFDVERASLAIVNEDRGALGRDLAAHFAASPAFRLEAAPRDMREASRALDVGDVRAILRIGQRFSADIEAGNIPDVQLDIDGRRTSTALAIEGYAQSIIDAYAAERAAIDGTGEATPSPTPRAWFNPNLISRWYVIPALIGLLTLVVTLVTTALSVARERELGTFDQLLVTPLSPTQILIGKTLPPLLVGLVEGAVIAVLGSWWFAVPFAGSVLVLMLSLLVFLLSAIGVGLMISALVRTQQQAILGAFLFMVPAILLSGFATPISSSPPWVQWLTLANPVRFFLAIARGVFLRGSGWTAIWPNLWPMMVIGAVTLIAAQYLFRNRLN